MKISTIINYIVSGLMWIFALLTMALNLLRLDNWDGTWVITVLYMTPLVVMSHIVAFVATFASIAFKSLNESKKYIILNSVSAVVSVCVFVVTFFLFSGWVGSW